MGGIYWGRKVAPPPSIHFFIHPCPPPTPTSLSSHINLCPPPPPTSLSSHIHPCPPPPPTSLSFLFQKHPCPQFGIVLITESHFDPPTWWLCNYCTCSVQGYVITVHAVYKVTHTEWDFREFASCFLIFMIPAKVFYSNQKT